MREEFSAQSYFLCHLLCDRSCGALTYQTCCLSRTIASLLTLDLIGARDVTEVMPSTCGMVVRPLIFVVGTFDGEMLGAGVATHERKNGPHVYVLRSPLGQLVRCLRLAVERPLGPFSGAKWSATIVRSDALHFATACLLHTHEAITRRSVSFAWL